MEKFTLKTYFEVNIRISEIFYEQKSMLYFLSYNHTSMLHILLLYFYINIFYGKTAINCKFYNCFKA